jgi:hypothetical protein
VRIDSVTVHADRVEAVVALGTTPVRTSEVAGLRERSVDLLPGLARHRCRHAEGRPLTEELADTEFAHLFEHVALELMALSGSPRTLSGETRWDWDRDPRGTFRVTLQYDDDLVCLGAVKGASAVVRSLAEDARAPSVDAIVSSLREVRRRPPEDRG